MKQIFLQIQDRLAAQVPGLKHIDKNWGQLNVEQPPVKFPCCLLDVEQVEYSQLTGRSRMAQADIALVVADQHIVRSSGHAPAKGDAYAILDILHSVMECLEGWRVPGTTQGLSRSRLEKSYSDISYDVYTLHCTAAWVEEETEEGVTLTATPPIRLLTDER